MYCTEPGNVLFLFLRPCFVHFQLRKAYFRQVEEIKSLKEQICLKDKRIRQLEEEVNVMREQRAMEESTCWEGELLYIPVEKGNSHNSQSTLQLDHAKNYNEKGQNQSHLFHKNIASTRCEQNEIEHCHLIECVTTAFFREVGSGISDSQVAACVKAHQVTSLTLVNLLGGSTTC